MSQPALNWVTVQNELRGFVYKRVKDKALTDDIVQDVFLKVQGRISQLRESEKIFGWIYQITRNTIIDHYRKNSRHIDVSDLGWDSAPANFNECVSGVIADLIPALPEKYRIPLQMTEIQNQSQLEVAKVLHLTYPAAKARVQRARKMLKEKIDEMLIVKTDGYGNVTICQDRKSSC
jgi:RNA polymerase sigma-70 factor, ECF subfamily